MGVIDGTGVVRYGPMLDQIKAGCHQEGMGAHWGEGGGGLNTNE